MSQQKNNKVRAGVLSALLAFTSVAGVATSAAAEVPGEVPEAAPIDTNWVQQYVHDALGGVTPVGTKASGRWIEYNLSNYCVSLHDGGSVVFKTCQTSSGKEGHATPAGEFKVYQKAAGPICMHPPGDKEVCGIHYATYWRKGGYAFHEAWWLGNRVNQRISHGCVNMRKADAKTVYDFATVGMRVSVHW